MRILITGSRDYTNQNAIAGAIWEAVDGTPLVIIHGACPTGADSIADYIARRAGLRVERYPADWETHGRKAGFVRNAEMVERGADICLAFVMPCSKLSCRKPKPHDSHGTAHCAGLAEKAGIPTSRIQQG